MIQIKRRYMPHMDDWLFDDLAEQGVRVKRPAWNFDNIIMTIKEPLWRSFYYKWI